MNLLTMTLIKGDIAGGVPVGHQRTIEHIVQTFSPACVPACSDLKRCVLAEAGRKGGKKRQPDVLQDMLTDWVRSHPNGTRGDLLVAIRSGKCPGFTLSAKGNEIFYATRGAIKRFSVTVLKQRLGRARDTRPGSSS